MMLKSFHSVFYLQGYNGIPSDGNWHRYASQIAPFVSIDGGMLDGSTFRNMQRHKGDGNEGHSNRSLVKIA